MRAARVSRSGRTTSEIYFICGMGLLLTWIRSPGGGWRRLLGLFRLQDLRNSFDQIGLIDSGIWTSRVIARILAVETDIGWLEFQFLVDDSQIASNYPPPRHGV